MECSSDDNKLLHKSGIECKSEPVSSKQYNQSTAGSTLTPLSANKDPPKNG